MKEKFQPGHRLTTKLGAVIEIEKHLCENYEEDIYQINVYGNSKILKWYVRSWGRVYDEGFIREMYYKFARGSIGPEFLWPQDIIEDNDDGFGYILNMIPEGYYEVTEFITGKKCFTSFKTMVVAAMGIVSAFRKIHNCGYYYEKFDFESILINSQNGKVLFGSVENIVADQIFRYEYEFGRFRTMAPELVMDKSMPNKLSDLYTMSVLLFLIFFRTHPLEGKRWLEAANIDPEKQWFMYGEEALFIMDENDKSNGPVTPIHKHLLKAWEVYPEYVRDIFIKAFSQNALKNPKYRPLEIEWLNVLARFINETILCECGNEIFIIDGNPCKCESCDRTVNIPFRLELREYSIAGVLGTCIYRCQLGTCDSELALIPIGRVISKKDHPEILGFKNMTRVDWKAYTPSGKEKIVAPGAAVPLIHGIIIEIDVGFSVPRIIKIKANEQEVC